MWFKGPQGVGKSVPILLGSREAMPRVRHREQRLFPWIHLVSKYLWQITQRNWLGEALTGPEEWGGEKALERRTHFSPAALEGSLPSLEPRRQDCGPVGVWFVLGSPHTWFKVLLSLSWNSWSFVNEGSPIFISPRALQIRGPVLLTGGIEQSWHLCLRAEPAGCRLGFRQADPSTSSRQAAGTSAC